MFSLDCSRFATKPVCLSCLEEQERHENQLLGHSRVILTRWLLPRGNQGLRDVTITPCASTPFPHIPTPAQTPFPYRPTHCALSKVKDRSRALTLSQSRMSRPESRSLIPTLCLPLAAL